MQQRMGLPVEVLSPAEVSGRWPHIEPDRLIGATWCPTDGFLHPHIIYGEGFRRTRELGVDVRQGIEVIGVRLRNGRILSLETTDGEVEADWFVNATNAWAPRVSRASWRHAAVHRADEALPLSHESQPSHHARGGATTPADDHLWHGAGAWSALRARMARNSSWPGRTPHRRSRIFPTRTRIASSRDISHEHGIENYGYAILAEMELFAPELANCGGLREPPAATMA